MKYKQKSMIGLIGDASLVFPTQLLLYSVLICYCLIENHFSEVKNTTTHLLVSFNSIGIMADYECNINKNQCLEWLVMIHWCFQPNDYYIQFRYVIAW